MLRGRKREQENGSTFKGQAGLSAQRSRFSWIRGCIWSGRFVSSSDGVRGGSPSRHASRAHDAASGWREVWHGAASGTANRASGTTTGTAHGTRRAASGAAHRTRRATGRARWHHHHWHRDRAEKVICRPAPTTATARLKAGRREEAVQKPPTQGHGTPCRPRQRAKEAGMRDPNTVAGIVSANNVSR
jgi:hypothetical protein